MPKKKTLEEVQETIDNIYGKGIWTILTYDGNNKPCTLLHKCGEVKRLSAARSIKSGVILCACDPFPKAQQESYEKRRIKKEDLQRDIDSIYGEGKWKVVDFSGMSHPLTLEHSCGTSKRISRAMNIKKGTCTCECELKRNQ